MSQIESYFAKVTEAYNTLINKETRELYDGERKSSAAAMKRATEQEPGFLARQNFTRAKQMIERNRRTDAVVFLEKRLQIGSRKWASTRGSWESC